MPVSACAHTPPTGLPAVTFVRIGVFMINGLRHISLALVDLVAGIRAYRELLGREPTMQTVEDDACCAYKGATAPKLGTFAKGSENQGTLFGLAFEVADADQFRRYLKRIPLAGQGPGHGSPGLFRPNVAAA
jgi:catechol 2,3-dioxygenase-like lactoylglutathione lyase family enzyme